MARTTLPITAVAEELLTVIGVSRYTGLSPSRIRQLAREGKLVPDITTTGEYYGTRLYRPSTVDRYLAERAEERVRALDAAEQARARAIASAPGPSK